MKLESTEQLEGSPTKTASDEAARSPVDTGPIDAEVTEPAKPRVARISDVKPLATVEVFGGEVNDTHNARAARGATSGEAPKGKRGRPKKVAPEPTTEPDDKQLDTARGVILMVDAMFRAHARGRFEEVLEEESLKALDLKLALQPGQVEALAAPLARGLAEEGVDLPWWAQLGMAGFGMYAGKLAMLSALEKKKSEREASQKPGA